VPTQAVEESSGEEEDLQEVEEDPQEAQGTQEEIRAAEAQEAQDPLSQEGSWSEEETIPGWQEHCHSSLRETAPRQNSS
jgi:hypothetical protein